MRKSGDIIWVNSQFSVALNASGEIDYEIAIIKDITERKLAETEVERLALYDYLTGLPNRRLFGDRLRTAVMAAKRSARYGAVIYIDLDNFKQLNDTHGHNTGDDFLKMVAHRLQRNLRGEDTVARLGGDEFVILLQNVSDSLPDTAAATAAIAAKIDFIKSSLPLISTFDRSVAGIVPAFQSTSVPSGDVRYSSQSSTALSLFGSFSTQEPT